MENKTLKKSPKISFGVIRRFLKSVHWEIYNFLSLGKGIGEYIDSPRFELEGCTWFLRMFPNNATSHVSVFLCMNDPITAAKLVDFSIGIKTGNGILNKQTERHTFKEGFSQCGWHYFLLLEDLQNSNARRLLSSSGTLTIACRLLRVKRIPFLEKVAPNPGGKDTQALITFDSNPNEEQDTQVLITFDPNPKEEKGAHALAKITLKPKEEKDSQQTTFMELEGLSSDFKQLLSSEKTCDFTVNVQGKEFRAHRSVLAARSPVFCAMFEHDTAEAKTGVLKIPDCHPEYFGEFLSFLYTGKIEDVSFETAYHLYSTSEKYDVQQLKSFCYDYLMHNLTVETVCRVYILSDQFCDHRLESAAQDFFNKNYLKIFLTSDWNAMLRNCFRLSEKLLKTMANAGLKNS